MTKFVAHPIVQGAIAGLLTAAAVDIQAFRAWTSYEEARRYNYKLAIFRWAQGAFLGAVTAAGIGGLVGWGS